MDPEKSSVAMNGDEGGGGGEETRLSRPTTPSMPIFDIIPKNEDEWWRPSHPPETYLWEEVRRQRQKGGYPWTLLDKENEDDIDANEYLDDNLYEPVNPPPLQESGSAVLSKDQVETGSLDGRRFGFEIPPEIEIVNSDGLDGLDLPDPHDHGFDGDKEWMHSDDEQVVPSKMSFCAGIRGQDSAKASDSDSHRSSIRPLTNKTITFDPATKDEQEEVESRRDASRGRRSRSRSRSRSPNPKEGSARKTTTAFEILKTKAAGAADQVKQRFSKIALPVRPKLNQWEGVKLSRKKHKKKAAAATASAVEPEGADQEGAQEEMEEETFEPMDTTAPQEFPFLPNEPEQTSQEIPVPEHVQNKEPAQVQDPPKDKDTKAEEQRKEKEAAAEKKKVDEAEKKRKQKELEEQKKQKAEEKKKEQEEVKRLKADAKQKAKEESDKKKADEKAAKQKLQEDAKKAKLEEQLTKARNAEELERQKNEELLRLREQEAAEKAAAIVSPPTPVPEEEEEEEEEEQHAQQEQQSPTSGTGSGSRRKKIKKTFVQLPQLPKMPDLPQLPHFDLDFKRKVIKRSKTPPGRPTPPKMKFKRGGVENTENQLAAQYASEIEARKLAMEEDEDEAPEMVRHIKFPEPPIFITQPSTEPSEETESQRDWKSFPSSSGRSDEPEEMGGMQSGAEPMNKQQVGTKERFDKFGQQLKGFGMKSKEIASKKSKAMGATLHKFGAKTSEKFQATIEEIKAKQDAAKARSKEKAKEAEDIEPQRNMEAVQYESATEPRRKFRFRRRDDSQEEQDNGPNKMQPEQYKHTQDLRQRGQEDGKEDPTDKITRSQLLGRAERDWESPLDMQHSRDVSEEPFSGNASSRDSPPGSSLASSTFAHARGPNKEYSKGVLEEIDSDEFFLREKGISEGEDEEEINRFLVEELRQAFRFQENALAGFDLDDPPERPDRQPKKPPRKEKEEKSYQTFPPERPKRKAPGYVSDYLKEHEEEEEMDEDQSSTREERGSFQEDLEQFEDEGIRRVKEELEKIDQDANNELASINRQEYIDDGRYEPISEEPIEPIKPVRRKKQKATPLYYNTVAGNEWMRDVEDQVLGGQEHTLVVPQQGELRASKSGSIPPENDEITFVDEDERHSSKLSLSRQEPSLAQSGSTGRVDVAEDDDNLEYVDEAGYAVVHKGHEAPSTVPRRHKKSNGGSKGNSLKRQGAQGQGTTANGDSAFFSLPRTTPRTFHIVPPSRPQRTYSTLRPRRPPRHRSNHSLTKSKGDKQDGSRPSTAIGIHGMHGRPLPPPPRPERPQIPLNDLDHTSIERSVGARHYANFVPDPTTTGAVEDLIVATNISLLGRGAAAMQTGDINIGIQTDPFQEYENENAAAGTSFEDITRRAQQISDSQNTAAHEEPRPRTPRPPSTGRDNQYSGSGQPSRESPFNFPRRLHLDELEVDVLRVNDLSAHSIHVEHLQAPQLEVNSLTCIGSLSVSSIHTQTLNADQINCNRLSSDTVDLPTVVPPSFYSLASRPPPSSASQEKPEELRHQTEKYDPDNEVICPYSPFEENDSQYENISSLKENLSFERSSVASPTEFYMSSRNVEFCLTPEQSMDNDDSWGQMDQMAKESQDNAKFGTEQTSSTPLEEDIAHYSDLPQDSAEAELSAELSSLSPEIPEGPRASPNFTVTREIATPVSRGLNETLKPTFKIAVLENQSSDEKSGDELDYLEEEFAGSEAPVVSGSLRLEYSRSPEVPTDLQVLHDMHVETENRPLSAQEKVFQRARCVPEAESEIVLGREEVRSSSSPSSGESTRPSTSRGTSLQRSRESESVDNAHTTSSVSTTTQPSPEREEGMLRMTMRFGRVLSRITMRGLQAIIDYIDIATSDDPAKAEEQRAHMQVLLCLLLILIVGIILSSNSTEYFSPPRWEFLMPPPHL